MTDGVSLPLERYIDLRLAQHTAEAKAEAKALALQAKEYERRLLDLNGAHERAVSVLNTYAPRDLVDRLTTGLADRIGKLELAQADRVGTSKATTAMVAFGSSFVTAVVVLLINRAWK